MYEFGCCYYTQPPDGGIAQDIIICASNLKVYKDFMDGNILIYIINIGNIGRGYAHRDTDFLRHSKLHEDTQTRRPECSVPISPSASMSGGGQWEAVTSQACNKSPPSESTLSLLDI